MGVFQSIIDRVVANATDRIMNARVSGDANDRWLVTGDGHMYSSDGTEALGTGLSTAKLYARRPSAGGGALMLRGSQPGLVNVQETQDFMGAPIMAVGESGSAVWGNDHILTTYGVFFPKACDFTIYGGMILSGLPIYTHAGPPGNVMSFADACGEGYDGGRTPTMGNWSTLVNCTATADNTTWTGASSPPNPTGYRTTHKFIASSAATMSWSIPAASSYPVASAGRVDMTIAVRSPVTPRSMTLSAVWWKSDNTSAGADTAGVAQTSSTGAFTFLRVSGQPPSGAVKVSPKVTVTSPASGEIHHSICCGIWSGLVPGDLTAWSPPYVFNQAGDGADLGGLYIRADGYRNPTQRVYTCVTAGAPGTQRWTNDITPYASPSRVNMYGHLGSTAGFAGTGTGNTPGDWLVAEVLGGMMRLDEEDMRSNNTAGAILVKETLAAGGQSTVVQWMRKTQSRGKPYVAKDGVTVFCYGIYDLGSVTSGQGFGVADHLDGAGSTSANGAIVNTLRSLICRARASVIYDVPAGTGTAPWTVLTMSAPSGAVDYASGSTRPLASDGTFRQMVTVTTHTFTFTIPADVQNGSEIAFDFLGCNGTFGGTITWTGTAATSGGLFSSGITSQITNVADAGFGHGRFVKRFTGLMASHAGQTIIGTLTQVDASGAVNLDCAYITGPRPSQVIVCGQYRLLAAGYTSFAGSYWAGVSEATCDATIQTLNTNLLALHNEFGPEVEFADLDAALNKQAAFFAADGVNINEDGAMIIAQVISRAVADSMSLVDPRQVVMDRHDKRATAVTQWIHPEGTVGAVVTGNNTKKWVADDHYVLTGVRVGMGASGAGTGLFTFDVLRGIGSGTGTSIWTTTGNRAVLGSGAFTGVSVAPPDLFYVAPGDWLASTVVTTGASGQNAQVTLYGKKISPP